MSIKIGSSRGHLVGTGGARGRDILGLSEGIDDGETLGLPDGQREGDAFGFSDGRPPNGDALGSSDADALGLPKGFDEGNPLGDPDGLALGSILDVGLSDGAELG